MFKWKSRQKEGAVKVIVEEVTNDQTTEVDNRLATLSKRILEVEDRLTEIEFNLKEEIANAASITKQLQDKLAILEAQSDRVANLATSTNASSASKDELLNLVNTLASALKNVQDRINLPF